MCTGIKFCESIAMNVIIESNMNFLPSMIEAIFFASIVASPVCVIAAAKVPSNI